MNLQANQHTQKPLKIEYSKLLQHVKKLVLPLILLLQIWVPKIKADGDY
jgi:hypothetical protein